MKKKYCIKFSEGLHMRPISKIVEITRRYKSTAHIVINEKKVNMKSLVEMILLDVKHNEIIELEIIGEDAKYVFEEMKDLEIEEV